MKLKFKNILKGIFPFLFRDHPFSYEVYELVKSKDKGFLLPLWYLNLSDLGREIIAMSLVSLVAVVPILILQILINRLVSWLV